MRIPHICTQNKQKKIKTAHLYPLGQPGESWIDSKLSIYANFQTQIIILNSGFTNSTKFKTGTSEPSPNPQSVEDNNNRVKTDSTSEYDMHT